MSNALCSECKPGNPLCVSCFPEFLDPATSEDPSPLPVFEFSIEDLFIPMQQRKHKTKPGQILEEKDILDFEKLDDKRAKVRTTRGLFCCVVTKNQKLKVVKVLRTKQALKPLTAPGFEDEDMPQEYDLSETPTSSVEDWSQALKEFLSEGRDNSTLEIIPKTEFVNQFLAKLQRA